MDEQLRQLTTVVAALVDQPVWLLSGPELTANLTAVAAAIETLTVAAATLVREIDTRTIHQAEGAPTVAAWLRDRLRLSIGAGRELAALAELLEARPSLRDAVACGAATTEQAAVIGAAISNLPAGVAPEVRDRAEAMLLAHAGQLDPLLLRRLAEQVITEVAPDLVGAAPPTVPDFAMAATEPFMPPPLDAGPPTARAARSWGN